MQLLFEKDNRKVFKGVFWKITKVIDNTWKFLFKIIFLRTIFPVC